MLAHLHVRQLLSKATPVSLLSALDLDDPVVPSESTQIPIGQRDTFKSLSGGISVSGILPEEYGEYVKTSRLVARAIQLTPGEAALVVNGRVSACVQGGDVNAADSYSKLGRRSNCFGRFPEGRFRSS